MGKLFEVIKKFVNKKVVTIVLLSVFIGGLTSYVFKAQFGLFIWGIHFESPVTWNNIIIEFPKNIRYKKSDKSIWFFHMENSKGYLSLKKIDMERVTKRYLIDFFEKKQFHVIESKDLSFKGNLSFAISYMDASGTYNENIYIVPRNLRIHYEGPKERFEDFKDVIEKIKFLDDLDVKR